MYNTTMFYVLKMTSSEFVTKMTAKQKEAVVRVIEQQGIDKLQNVSRDFLNNTVMLQFTHIVIGVESDGYAHS